VKKTARKFRSFSEAEKVLHKINAARAQGLADDNSRVG
jgi:hypothetical protein